ncbi:hypothetical protein L2E82_35643 [Cichorium intybus]|uniref:Uncharacterized protein n=1 Tax=Cichorium intybus TaxID=13427 RepID=A0ACB9BPD7_CICIN|nr:hypothetical protein L2E82_35643 [Cichorium intybus]
MSCSQGRILAKTSSSAAPIQMIVGNAMQPTAQSVVESKERERSYHRCCSIVAISGCSSDAAVEVPHLGSTDCCCNYGWASNDHLHPRTPGLLNELGCAIVVSLAIVVAVEIEVVEYVVDGVAIEHHCDSILRTAAQSPLGSTRLGKG